MKQIVGTVVATAFWVGVAFWAYVSWYEPRQQSSVARSESKARALASLQEGATTRTMPTPEGDLIEINMPTRIAPGIDFVENRRCLVWRDRVTNTSSMQCEAQPSLIAE